MKMKNVMNWFAGTIALVVMLGISSTAVADYVSAVLSDAPIAYWQFEDGNLGDKLIGDTATDSAGSHHGTYAVKGGTDGVELVAGVPGIGGLAGHFVGSSSSRYVGEYVLYDTLGNFGSNIDNNGATFEFWMKNFQTGNTANVPFGVVNDRPGGAKKTQLVFRLHDSGSADDHMIFLRDDSNVFMLATFDNSVKNVNDGDWHHVAWVIEPGVPAGGMKTYVDGTLMPLDWHASSGAPSNFADLDKAFVVGGEYDYSDGLRDLLVNAMIDEFAIYGKALTQTEIQAHIDAVPEPSTLVLLATGLIGLLCYAWRKRK